MKLIVQIPCFNEAETLPGVVAAIPRRIPGLAVVEVLVVDDGSTDGTAEVARACGVEHVLVNKTNLGLARSFQRGLHACLERGADVVVNTDGDGQYAGASIPALVRPILEGRADIVVGDRDPGANPAFSPLKRRLQRLGSAAVRLMSGVDAADAVSGFRAYSRQAALSTNVMTTFSYTTETLIHAGARGHAVVSVPVATNAATRPSRLFRSLPGFLKRQCMTILRSFVMYRPLVAFGLLGLAMGAMGLVPILRFLWFYAQGDGGGHVQSLLLGAMFFALGYVTLVIAFLSDTIATNRQLLEATLERVRRIELATAEPADALAPAAEAPERATIALRRARFRASGTVEALR